MGGALKRPFKSYNIEARAAKALDLSKKVPKAPPRYPTEAAIEARNKATLDKEANNIHQQIPELNERLKHVYVESKGDNPVIKTKRKLPEDRRRVNETELGYLEPINLPEGKISLRLALDMIESYQMDSQTNSAKVLAEKHKLDLETTFHILEYFQPFLLKIPRAEDVVPSTHPLLRDHRMHAAQKRLDTAQKLIDDYQNKRKS